VSPSRADRSVLDPAGARSAVSGSRQRVHQPDAGGAAPRDPTALFAAATAARGVQSRAPSARGRPKGDPMKKLAAALAALLALQTSPAYAVVRVRS
jgi:hypothetical protein